MAAAGRWSSSLVIAGTAVLFWPAIRAMALFAAAPGARSAQDDIVEARIDTAAARDWAYLTFGWGASPRRPGLRQLHHGQ